jgi:DMSO/TMAO reductase YedYZ molybdopterin-dependent catalytic subunit
MRDTTRRQFLRGSLGLTGAVWAGSLAEAEFLEVASSAPATQGGEFLGTVPFIGEGSRAVGRLTGRGLSGRLALDLSRLDAERLVTPTEEFFVRTRAPEDVSKRVPWTIRTEGLMRESSVLPLERLLAQARPLGVHLVECSGNNAYRRFGLMSSARWSGVPLADLVGTLPLLPEATRVLFIGFDEHSGPRGSSAVGASWIFTFEELERAGAFLATRMNGAPLTPDHGYPIRLVVPGRYGCVSIKWLEEIQFVDDSAPATSQMREFAGRTHQQGVPELARDYAPATVDFAAMPVRVEKWTVDGELKYRVVGIAWGGARTTGRLRIRFNSGESLVAVEDFDHRTTTSWNLWSHTWRPAAPGRYGIELQVPDPAIRTRRLDRGYYLRTVEIDEV